MSAQKLFLILGAFCVLLISRTSEIEAQAATVTGWSPDARVPGYLDDTFTPFLLTDQSGVVHAFASQSVAGVDDKAIVYRQWTLKGGWTRPVDILLTPTGDATILGGYIDKSGIVHVIFKGQGENNKDAIYYSKVPIAVADLAKAWLPPVIIGEDAFGFASISVSAAIAGDDHGNIIVIYCSDRDGPGVYFVSSTDAGENWSESSPVFLTYDSDLLPSTLRLVTGSDRYFHATWDVTTSSDIGVGLYFTSYDTLTSEWSSPLELDRRIDLPDFWGPSFPAMIDNGNDLVVLYNGGNPYVDQYAGRGRPVMRAIVSKDGGITWNGPSSPFPLLNGRSGEHALAVDGLGGVHGLFVMRIDAGVDEYEPIGGIWHSTFDGQAWNVPERFITSVLSSNVRAVTSHGNVLLVVWIADLGEDPSGVWYSYKVLDIPPAPLEPVAQPAPVLPISTPTIVSMPEVFSVPTRGSLLNDSQSINSPTLPLSVGLVSVVALVVVVLIIFGHRTHKKG